MYPVLSSRFENKSIVNIKPFVIDALSIVVGISFITASLEDVLKMDIVNLFSSISADVGSISDLYNEAHIAASEKSSLNLFRPDRGIRIFFTDIIYFIIFYRFTLGVTKKDKIISGILLFGLLLNIFSSIEKGSRSLFFFFLMNTIFCFFLFNKKILPFYRKKIVFALTFFGILSILALSLITFGRFGSKAHTSVFTSITSYMGQSFLHFNEYVPGNRYLWYGNYSFPVARKVLGLQAALNPLERRDIMTNCRDLKSGVFYTHIGCFCFDFGMYITFFILLCLFIIFYIKRHLYTNAYYIHVHELFLLYFLFIISYQGAFLFVYAGYMGNIILLTNLAIYLLFKFSYLRERLRIY